jgi:hypothetical protein
MSGTEGLELKRMSMLDALVSTWADMCRPTIIAIHIRRLLLPSLQGLAMKVTITALALIRVGSGQIDTRGNGMEDTGAARAVTRLLCN